jgi:hypothetical protein
MVSNARLDLPEPDRPVKTISASRGRSRETSLRLCSRAPRMMSWSVTTLLRTIEQVFAILRRHASVSALAMHDATAH